MVKKLATLAVKTKEVVENHVKGIANSLTLTRQGTTIAKEAVEGIEGKKVPLLRYHNWSSTPIGSATMTSVDDEGLHYEGEIFDSIEDKQQILDSINSGVMSVSVGFGYDDMDEDGVIHSLELYELSITPVPADGKATITQGLELTDTIIEDESSEDENDSIEKEDNSSELLDLVKSVKQELDSIKDIVSKLTSKPDEEDPADEEPEDSTQSMIKTIKDITYDFDMPDEVKSSLKKFIKTYSHKENN